MRPSIEILFGSTKILSNGQAGEAALYKCCKNENRTLQPLLSDLFRAVEEQSPVSGRLLDSGGTT